MKKYYAVFSKRGMWAELLKGPRGGTKRISIFAKDQAEKTAVMLSKEHKQQYWIEEVTITRV